ncbi:MAG: hypothetical protein WC663_02415 [Patescibacteria group bacterium]|jgi:hypothetical protein
MPNPEQPQPIQENIADVTEPQQQNVEGLEVAHGEELENVVDAANALAEKIERDEKVTEGEVDDLREALGQMKIDVGGEIMTLEEFKGTYLEILKEIKSGNLTRSNELRFLTDSVATTLENSRGTIFLSGLTSLSDSAAEILSHHHFDIILNGLTSLSDSAAESFGHHRGNLFLRGLTSLSDKAAKSLGHRYGDLYLDSLKTLSDSAAESLRHLDGSLYLDGLSTLSDSAAESFSNQSWRVYFMGLVSLSDQAIESLSHFKGNYLGVPDNISDKINKFKTKK